jgi:hypothetical protein
LDPWSPCDLDYPAPCDFFITYIKGPAPIGILSEDVFAIGMHDPQVPNFTFGCAYKGVENQQLPNGWTYGLDLSKDSFFVQIAPQYNNIMSYCLTNQDYDVKTMSWISFGGQKSKQMNFTSLVEGTRLFTVN